MALRVLIVDDDAILTDVLSRSLGRSGHYVRVANEGARGLEILSYESIDVVILDVMLPDMDGFEICRIIRSNPKTSRLPILMLSGRSQVVDRLAGLEAGADDYVTKPVVVKEIAHRIEVLVLSTQKALSKTRPVLAFVGAKGGVGTSTVALNVSLSLVAQGQKVILLDMGSMGPTSAWTLGLEPRHTLVSLEADRGIAFSLSDVQDCVLTHSSALDYLLDSARYSSAADPHGRVLAEALAMLRTSYEVIVLDVGAGALVHSEALAYSSSIIPVAQNDFVCLRHLEGVLTLLERGQLLDKVPGFVLVESCLEPDRDTPSAIARRVGLDILAVIPPVPSELYHANRLQQPLLLAHPTSAASQAIRDLAQRVVVPATEPAQ